MITVWFEQFLGKGLGDCTLGVILFLIAFFILIFGFKRAIGMDEK